MSGHFTEHGVGISVVYHVAIVDLHLHRRNHLCLSALRYAAACRHRRLNGASVAENNNVTATK